MNFSSRKGVLRGRRGQQLEYDFFLLGIYRRVHGDRNGGVVDLNRWARPRCADNLVVLLRLDRTGNAAHFYIRCVCEPASRDG